jgi:hypothetical protein
MLLTVTYCPGKQLSYFFPVSIGRLQKCDGALFSGDEPVRDTGGTAFIAPGVSRLPWRARGENSKL